MAVVHRRHLPNPVQTRLSDIGRELNGSLLPHQQVCLRGLHYIYSIVRIKAYYLLTRYDQFGSCGPSTCSRTAASRRAARHRPPDRRMSNLRTTTHTHGPFVLAAVCVLWRRVSTYYGPCVCRVCCYSPYSDPLLHLVQVLCLWPQVVTKAVHHLMQ